jgi:hypothetical protein
MSSVNFWRGTHGCGGFFSLNAGPPARLHSGGGVVYGASREPNVAIMRRITARTVAGMVSITEIADGP